MGDLTPNLLRRLKRKGLSDARIAKLMGVSEKTISQNPLEHGHLSCV